VNGPVFSGDVVKTDGNGSAQIHFADNTRMVIGPNSNVTLDSFVFAGKEKASKFTIDALRGSFRFITGASAKNVYTINTPTATIGVRGTEFDTHIADDGTTTASLWEGGIRVCDRATPRHCTEIVGTCSMIRITPENTARRINGVYDRTAILDADFPYAFRQAWLEPDFRVASSSCEIRDLDSVRHSDGTNAEPPPQQQSEDECGDGGCH
jgi:hypothetical protein